MQARLLLGALFIAMAAGLWFAIDAGATARAELKQEAARADGLAKQVASVAEEYTKRLKAQEEGYRVRDSRNKAAQERRAQAEARANKTDSAAMDWRTGRVAGDIVDSLCLKAGSCAVSIPGEAASGTDEAGTGNAAQGYRLTNDSLRAGIENLRQDLATCNGQLLGIQAWADSLTKRK